MPDYSSYAWLIVLSELVLLFITSRQVTSAIFFSVAGITRSQRIATAVLALIFFPGVLIHELSHYFMAKLLFVRTGKISLIPHRAGNSIKLGSVEVAKTDRFRSLLIGVAPLIAGVGILSGIFYYYLSTLTISNLLQQQWWMLILLVYFIFVIAGSMFSSKKDVEGGLFFLMMIAILGVSSYLLFPTLMISGWNSFYKVVLTSSLMTAMFQALIPPLIIQMIIIGMYRLIRR